MNISVFTFGNDVYVNCECIKGYAFRNAILWVESALLAVFLPILTALFKRSGDNYALLCLNKTDYFECLLPHEPLA